MLYRYFTAKIGYRNFSFLKRSAMPWAYSIQHGFIIMCQKTILFIPIGCSLSPSILALGQDTEFKSNMLHAPKKYPLEAYNISLCGSFLLARDRDRPSTHGAMATRAHADLIAGRGQLHPAKPLLYFLAHGLIFPSEITCPFATVGSHRAFPHPQWMAVRRSHPGLQYYYHNYLLS